MRIGIFHNKPYYLRYYETALRALVERGHHLVLARPDRFDEVKVPAWLQTGSRVSAVLYPHAREDGLDQTVEIVRTARDAARFLRPELRAAEASRQRAVERLARVAFGDSRLLRGAGELAGIEWAEQAPTALNGLFEDLERLIPPDGRIMRLIRDERLDLVFCISRINIAARQTEVVKAAVNLGIPTGIVVYSWDNLSNKGVLHVQPDRLFVWNEVQVREATELHGMERARVTVTGAPRFDAIFDGAPSAPPEMLQRDIGLDPGRPTILYLGSSTFVAPREPEFVTAWLAALRASEDDRIRGANVLVRPHPGTVRTKPWAEWKPTGERVALLKSVMRSSGQDLFDQLSACDAVVALNTSAEIEAAILGKPVLTVRAGALAPGQEGQLHFRYLLEEHGGFVQTAATLDEHVAKLREALARDPLAAARQRFLASFVRPLGIDVPAGLVLADELEALAHERAVRRRFLPAVERLTSLMRQPRGPFERGPGTTGEPSSIAATRPGSVEP